MQIEVDDIIEIPDYTDSDRYKKLKNETYKMAKRNEPFDMDLPADEYRYYAKMWHIFKKLIANEITKEEAGKLNEKIFAEFRNNQTAYAQHICGVLEWNSNIKKSEQARINISKAKSKSEIVEAIIECVEALTGDKTMRDKIRELAK